MPGRRHGPSIKCPEIYEALRRKGYSKTKAAKISNAQCKKKKLKGVAKLGTRKRRRR